MRAKGEPRAACAHLARAVQLADAQYDRAIAPRALEHSDDATHAPKQAAPAANFEFVELLSQLGGVLDDLRQFDEVIGCYERASALAPRSAALHHAIGRAQYGQGRFEQ